MATRAGRLRHAEAPTRSTHSDMVEMLRRASAATHVRVAHVVIARRERPRLAMVGIPLAVVAALLSDVWWALPVLVCGAWWWAPRDWGWEWLVAVGRGLIGLEWAYMGVGALAAFPADRLVVGFVWAGLPVALTVYSAGAWRKLKSAGPR